MKQAQFIADAIENRTFDEGFFDSIVETFTKKYEMTDEEREFFNWGLVNGFITCLEGCNHLFRRKKEENLND